MKPDIIEAGVPYYDRRNLRRVHMPELPEHLADTAGDESSDRETIERIGAALEVENRYRDACDWKADPTRRTALMVAMRAELRAWAAAGRGVYA